MDLTLACFPRSSVCEILLLIEKLSAVQIGRGFFTARAKTGQAARLRKAIHKFTHRLHSASFVYSIVTPDIQYGTVVNVLAVVSFNNET
jgi:hypothetical protein